MKCCHFFLACLFASLSFAAPPKDLTDFRTEPGPKKLERSLGEEDITYIDASKHDEEVPSDSARVRFDVVGRTRSGRKGIPVLRLKKGEFVRLLGYSKDRRWVAVQALRGKRPKLWLPTNAIQRHRPKNSKASVEADFE